MKTNSVLYSVPLTTTQTTSQQKEDIVEKLHGVLANLRRNRDEEHRKKQLAAERLSLIQQEREAMEKNVHSIQQALLKLQQQSNPNEIAELQARVERLSQEVQFQHNELLGKRDKVSRLRATAAQDAKQREATLVSARHALQVRRGRKIVAVPTPREQNMDAMKALLLADDNDHWHKWPKVIEQQAIALSMEAADVHRQCETISRRIAGYKKHLGIITSSSEEESVPMEEQEALEN